MAFISYDSYKNRIEKLAKFKNFVSKYKFLIMGVLAVIIAGAATLMALKGMVTTDTSLSTSSFTYGEGFTPAPASAFLSDVGYEYAVRGTDEWTNEKPVKVGKYSVRAVTKKLFGKGYGTPVDFEILPKPVEFVFADATSLIYGDRPEGYGISGLVSGDKIDGVDFTYKYNDTGAESEWTVDVTALEGSVKIVDGKHGDVSDCYTYPTAGKTFALKKRPVSVGLKSKNATYCGAVILPDSELLPPDLAAGDSIRFETEITQNGLAATLLNAGIYGISVKENSVRITDASGADVTHRYDIGAASGATFTVNRKALTVTTAGDTRVYNGAALSKEGGTPDGLIDGHTLSTVGDAPSITDVGTVPNEQLFDVNDVDGKPVTDNYKISYVYGNLTVTPCPLTITTASGEWEYDGLAHSVTTPPTVNGLVGGQSLSNVTYNSVTGIKDSGKNTNSVTYDIVWTASGEKVDKNNYKITSNFGDLIITPREITVRTGTATFAYDGKPHSYDYSSIDLNTLIVGGSLALSTHSLAISGAPFAVTSVADTKAGNEVTKFKVVSGIADESDNYKILYQNGTLTVTGRELGITTGNGNWEYNGQAQYNEAITATSGALAPDHAFKVTQRTEVTDVTDGTANELSYIITDDSGNDVTSNYILAQPVWGTLVVTQRHINVRLNNVTLPYGAPVAYQSGDETAYNLVSGHTVAVNAAEVTFGCGALPDVDDYKISYDKDKIKILSDGKDVTKNYVVDSVFDGTFTVTQREITVKLKDMTGIIYGEKIDYEVKPGNYANTPDLVAGETLTVKHVDYRYSAPTVGSYGIYTYQSTENVQILKAGGVTPSTDNYIIYFEEGTLTIVARPIRILSGTSADLVYDGTAQYDDSFEVLLDNPKYYDILPSHEIVVTDCTTVTDVTAAVQNRHDYKIVDDTGYPVTDNYEIYTSSGYLMVKPRPITVKASSYEKAYGENFNYSSSGKPNYEKITKGSLAAYDGAEETLIIFVNSLEFDGFVKRAVGTYAVHPDSYQVTKVDGVTDSSHNYTVDFEDGTLTITKKAIEVELPHVHLVYGSDDYLGESYAQLYAGEIVVEALPFGEQLKFTLDFTAGGKPASPKKLGFYGVAVIKEEILNSDGSISPNGNYSITYTGSKVLQIATRSIQIIPKPVSAVYGESFAYPSGSSNFEFVTIGNNPRDYCLPKYGEEIEITIKYALDGATPPSAGKYDAEVDYVTVHYPDGSTETGYLDSEHATYAFFAVGGYWIMCKKADFAQKLEITARDIKVTLNDMPGGVYGEDIIYKNGGETADDLLDGHTVYVDPNGINFTAKDGSVYPNAGKYAISTTSDYIKVFSGETEVTKNYNVTEVIGGTLTISARPITITLGNATSVYGNDLGLPEITVTGLVNGDEFNPAYLYLKGGAVPARYDVDDYDIVLDSEKYSFTYTNSAPSTTKNYEIEWVTPDAILTVTPRPVTIPLVAVSVNYGADDLAAKSYYTDFGIVDLSGLELPDGEALDVTIIFMQDGAVVTPKNVGVYDVIVDKDATTVINGSVDNYIIDYTEDVTFEITYRNIYYVPLEVNSYYGDEIKYPTGADNCTTNSMPYGEALELLVIFDLNNQERPAVGDYAILVSGINIYDSEGNLISETSIPKDMENYTSYYSDNYYVYPKYIPSLSPVKLHINPKTVELTLLEFEGEYEYGDGEKLVYPAYMGNFVAKDELAYGEKLQIAISWLSGGKDVVAPKNAGTYNYQIDKENSIVYDAAENEISGGINNYDLVYDLGEVVISPYSFRFHPGGDAKTYDGAPYAHATGYGNYYRNFASQILPYNEDIEIFVKYYDEDDNLVASPTDAGTYKIYFDEDTPVNVKVGLNPDAVAENYDLSSNCSILKISKRPITVSAIEGQEFVYGVEEVTPKFMGLGFPQDGVDEGRIYAIPGGWEYSADGEEWLDGNDIWLNGIVLPVGTYFVRCTYVIVTYDKGVHYAPIGKNHDVTYEIGTFKVIAREVRLVTNTRTDFIYNGDFQYDYGYTLYYKNSAGEWTEFTLPDDATVNLGDYTKVKDAGTEDNVVELTIPNYDIVETVWGTLTVNPREITIESATNKGLIYDGTAQSDSGCKVTVGELVAGHSISVSNPATVTTVADGEVTNKLTYTILDGDNNPVTTNYAITEVNGTIKIKPRPVKIKSATNTDEWIYDGDEHFDEGFELIQEAGVYALVEGHEVNVVGNTKVRTVMQGAITNVLTYEIVDGGGNDLTENYDITPVNGALKINPMTITVTLKDGLKVTYGDGLYPDGMDNYDLANSTPLVTGEKLSVSVMYKTAAGNVVMPRNVGTYTVVLDLKGCYVRTAYGENGFENYTVENAETEQAQLTILPKEIEVTLNTLPNKVYGELFAGYPAVDGNFESDGDVLVGTDALQVHVRYFKGGKEVVINEQTPVYADGYDVKIDYCTVNGTDYYRAESDSIIDAGNYIITFVGSTLTVDPRLVTVVTGSAAKDYYDGTALSCEGYERVYYTGYDDGIMSWDTADDVIGYVENSANSIINAESVSNEAQFVSNSDNYEIVNTVKGTLTIGKRPVKIELLQIEGQVYGTRLTYPDGSGEANFGYAADSEYEVVDGEKLVIAVMFFGSDGEADPKNADDYYYIFDLDGSTVTDSIGGAGIDNYTITCTDKKYASVSKLTVYLNLRPWSPVEYDGEYHEYDGGIDNVFPYDETMVLAVDYYTVSGGVKTLLDGTFPKDAGSYLVKYNKTNSTIGGIAPDVNYNIFMTPEDGIPFTVTPKDITIVMNDESRIYSGTPFDYVADYTPAKFVSDAAGSDMIVPDAVIYDDGTPKNVGTYKVTLQDFRVEGGKKSNYNLLTATSKLYCEVEITARDITFTVDDLTLEMGEEINSTLTVGGYGFAAGETLTPEYTYFVKGAGDVLTPIAKDKIDKRGTYTVRVSFTDEDGILANYNPTYEDGTLEITARNVTVSPIYTGGSLIYDGQPIDLKNFNYKHVHTTNIEEDGFVEGNVPASLLVFTDEKGNRIESPDAPVNAGKYVFSVEFIGVDEDDYLIHNGGKIEFTIQPRPVTVTLSGYAASKLDGYLTYNYSVLPNTLVTATASNIVEGEASVPQWYYHNKTLGEEVKYNYAGNYEVLARIVKADGSVDTNYKVTDIDDVTFTVEKAVIYITPKSKSAPYHTAGQELKLNGDDYYIKKGALYGGDTLTIEGSGTLKTARSMPVTIKSAKVMQGTTNVTHSYDVRYKYDSNSPVPATEFTATLSFTPVKIYYKQEVLDDAHRFFNYNGQPHDLGIDKNNLQNYIDILNAGDFVGSYTLQYIAIPVVAVREYEKWIQILVFDGDGNNVTSLYDFSLQNAEQSKVVVYGDYLDFDLDDGCDLSDVTPSTLYNGYDVLNSGYTVTGLTKLTHRAEVLVKDGELFVVVYDSAAGGRVEASMTYSLRVPDGLGVSVKLTPMGKLLAS